MHGREHKGTMRKSASGSGSRGRGLNPLSSLRARDNSDEDGRSSGGGGGSGHGSSVFGDEPDGGPALRAGTLTGNTSANTSAESLDGALGAERDAVLELLQTEKRKSSAATRDAALDRLNALMAYSYAAALLGDCVEELGETLLKLVRREGATRAIRSLGLLALTLPEEMDAEAADAVLRPIIKDSERDDDLRQAALDGLAQVYFLATEPDGAACLSLLEFLEELFAPASSRFGHGAQDSASPTSAPLSPTTPASAAAGPPASAGVLDAALRAWGVVLAMRKVELDDADIERMCEALLELLDHASLDVRISAGEAVALLYELNPKADFVYGHELEAKAQALSSVSAKSTSKRDKAAQRRSFRDILATIGSAGASGPAESLKIRSDEIELRGWAALVRLDALRDLVGESLNVHLVHNERLRDVFGFAEVSDESGKVTAYERQLARRMRKVYMDSDRGGKRAESGGR